MAARERERARRRERVLEERPVAAKALLHPVRDHLGADECEDDEQRVRDVALSQGDDRRDDHHHGEERAVSCPGERSEGIGERVGRASVEPVRNALIVPGGVSLGDLLGDCPERPGRRRQHDQRGQEAGPDAFEQNPQAGFGGR